MYNKKVLKKAVDQLDKAKAPGKPKDIIVDPAGQWKFPGQNTRIPNNQITMKGVDYPVIGVANTGQLQMMYPGAEYTFPGANYVDEYPQMQNGGNTTCPEGYVYYNGQCVKWEEPTYNQSPNSGYNAATSTIQSDPNNPFEQEQWWNEHEKFHHLQNLAGGMSSSGAAGQRPNPYAASDESMGNYYNRRDQDVETQIDQMISENPSLQFIPKEKLRESIFPVEGEGPSFVGAEDLIYANPFTLEGEARVAEENFRNTGQSMFPQMQDGGEQDGMNAMMKARLAYANEFGNPAAKRMINLPDNPYQFDNGDTGTHYMASMDNYAVPQIQDENGQLMLGDYGPESNEAMRFESDEDANYFAKHYKDVSPGFMEMDLSPEEIEEYAKGGFIIEDISVPELSKAQTGGQSQYYTVKGSDGVYRKVNGKWETDWNRSGNFQPLTKGDVAKRTAVLNSQAKRMYDPGYDELIRSKQTQFKPTPKPVKPVAKPTPSAQKAQQAFDKDFKLNGNKDEYTLIQEDIKRQQDELKTRVPSATQEDLDEIETRTWNNVVNNATVGAPRQFNFEQGKKKEAPQGYWSKALDIASNPMTAAGYLMRGQDIPDYLQRDLDNGTLGYWSNGALHTERNPLDIVSDVTPLGLIGDVRNVYNGLSNGNYGQAAWGLAGAIPGIGELRSAGKAVKGAKPMGQLATEGKLGPMFNNQKAIKHFNDREKYFGQWFTKDKNDFDFYTKDREFTDPKIINLKVPESKLEQYQNYDKTLSSAPDGEFVIPQEEQLLYRQPSPGSQPSSKVGLTNNSIVHTTDNDFLTVDDVMKHKNTFDDLKRERLFAMQSPEGQERLKKFIDENPHLQGKSDIRKTEYDPYIPTQRDVLQGFANMDYVPEVLIKQKESIEYARELLKKGDISEKEYEEAVSQINKNINNLGYSPDSAYMASTILNPRAGNSDLMIGSNFTNDEAKRVIRHEMGHYFQGSNKSHLDTELEDLALKTEQGANKYNKTDNESFMSKVKSDPDYFNKAKEYWKSGSNGAEKTPFLEEVRADMLEKGIIKNLYDEITPDMLKTHYKKYLSENSSYPLRVYDIMKDTPSNFKLMSKVINKMPALVPIAGTAALAAGSLPKDKNGGIVSNLSNKEINDLISQGYIIEEQ